MCICFKRNSFHPYALCFNSEGKYSGVKMLLGMFLLCRVPTTENDSIMETERKHQPLLKVTEILLENLMCSYSAH